MVRWLSQDPPVLSSIFTGFTIPAIHPAPVVIYLSLHCIKNCSLVVRCIVDHIPLVTWQSCTPVLVTQIERRKGDGHSDVLQNKFGDPGLISSKIPLTISLTFRLINSSPVYCEMLSGGELIRLWIFFNGPTVSNRMLLSSAWSRS
jgi:hypothetical protein